MPKPKKVKATASLRLEVETMARKGFEVVDVVATVTAAGVAIEKKAVRKRKPGAVPIAPDETEIIISEDGCFVLRLKGKWWTCQLSPNERKLMHAVGKKGGSLDGDAAYGLLWPKKPIDDGKKLRDVVTHINTKLKRRDLPVHLSFSDWCVKINTKPTI